MTPYEITAAHYSNAIEEDEVLCSFESMDELMNILEAKNSIFEAMMLVREINEINKYEVIGRYEIAKLKKHFLKNEMLKKEESLHIESKNVKNKIENVTPIEKNNENSGIHFSKNDLLSIQPYSNPYSYLPFHENQSSISIKAIQSESGIINTKNDFLQNELTISQREKSHSKERKMRELQKGYMRLLSNQNT